MKIIWDSDNIAHLAKHKVTPEFAEKIIEAGRVVPSRFYGRYIIEATIKEVHYRLIYDVLDDGISIYPVTAFSIRKLKIQQEEAL